MIPRIASFSPVAMLDTPLPEGRGGSRGRAFRRLEADVERPSARRCIVREGRVGVETERRNDASQLVGRMIGRAPVDFRLDAVACPAWRSGPTWPSAPSKEVRSGVRGVS